MDFTDPFQMQKQMFKTWEKEMNQAVEKFLREPAFMQNLSKNMQQALDLERMIQSHMEPVLKKMGLPSREDFEKLAHNLHMAETRALDLEEKVLLLTEEVASLKATKAPTKKAATPKKTTRKKASEA